MGSAALHMCQIAAGNGDIFFEFGIHCWDYAAAVLIVREAGGFCCNFDGTLCGLKFFVSFLQQIKLIHLYYAEK